MYKRQHIRQGEKLSDPEFGTIIWDILFEPLTPALKDAVTQNITRIVNTDPRVKVKSVIVDQFESGIQVEIELEYFINHLGMKKPKISNIDHGLEVVKILTEAGEQILK